MTFYMPSRTLPPLKREAVEDLGRGPIVGSWANGWQGVRGRYNTHTIAWVESVGWGAFNRDRTKLTITKNGEMYLSYAAAIGGE